MVQEGSQPPSWYEQLSYRRKPGYRKVSLARRAWRPLRTAGRHFKLQPLDRADAHAMSLGELKHTDS
jgi:hypothetical protein